MWQITIISYGIHPSVTFWDRKSHRAQALCSIDSADEIPAKRLGLYLTMPISCVSWTSALPHEITSVYSTEYKSFDLLSDKVVFLFFFFSEKTSVTASCFIHCCSIAWMCLHLYHCYFLGTLHLALQSVFLSSTICSFSDWKMIRWSPGRSCSFWAPGLPARHPDQTELPDRHFRLSQESQHMQDRLVK